MNNKIYEIKICDFCHKKMKPIKNDWDSRPYHKSCYKQLQQNYTFEELLKQIPQIKTEYDLK